MAEIRLGKLVSGDFIIGVNDEENKGIKNIGSLQFVPAETGGMSVALIPFGFPFENEFTGFISNDKIIYEIEKVPEDLQNKYDFCHFLLLIINRNSAELLKIY